jgi:radical S-adenosyl methionine domain-containing protein 2
MRCKFCFARFQDVKNSILPVGHLSQEQAVEIVKQVAVNGFEKITFAGGEPLLCPWLTKLISVAKQSGMTTMVVTNGSLLTTEFLQMNRTSLDWITISIDSLNPQTNLAMGRAIAGINPLSKMFYRDIVEQIKDLGYGLKINTVVNSKNHLENMSEFINSVQPERWKIMQALPLKGQNDKFIDELQISIEQFNDFVQSNFISNENIKVITENNNEMQGSYVMIDPAGRFFDNSDARYNYSKPILEIGVEAALNQVNYDLSKFKDRGGVYSWDRTSINNYSKSKLEQL